MLIATVILAIVSVPIGAKVEDFAYTRLSVERVAHGQQAVAESTQNAPVNAASDEYGPAGEVLEPAEQAAVIGFIAALLWMLVVVVTYRLSGWVLERRRLESWGREWDRVGPK